MRQYVGSCLLSLLILVASTPMHADTKGEQLLHRAERIAQQTQTVEAVLLRSDSPITGTLRMKKPSIILLNFPDANGKKSVIASQGRHLVSVEEASNSGNVMDYEELYDFANISATILYLTYLLEPGQLRSFVHPTFAGAYQRDNVTYQVVKCPPSFGRSATTFYIGQSGLLEGIEMEAIKSTNTTAPAQKLWVRDLRLNVPLTPQQCAYTPPATVHITTDKENPYHDFLPVGATAPLFDLKTPTGSPLSLADLLKSNRAVLLNFTFAECGACVLELPTVKEIHKLKDKGLAVVAINLTDSREKAKDFLVKYQIPYPMGLDGKDGGGKEQVSNAYRAMSGGTNYLLSSQGKVLWRHSNINEVRLRCVLEANHISAFSKN